MVGDWYNVFFFIMLNTICFHILSNWVYPVFQATEDSAIVLLILLLICFPLLLFNSRLSRPKFSEEYMYTTGATLLLVLGVVGHLKYIPGTNAHGVYYKKGEGIIAHWGIYSSDAEIVRVDRTVAVSMQFDGWILDAQPDAMLVPLSNSFVQSQVENGYSSEQIRERARDIVRGHIKRILDEKAREGMGVVKMVPAFWAHILRIDEHRFRRTEQIQDFYWKRIISPGEGNIAHFIF